MTVRISATDWVEGGIDGRRRGARSPGRSPTPARTRSTSRPARSTPDERPDFGRSYQTPYADAIRNQVGVPTIAVGVISSYDDVNSIILAGRADLCALGRVHLYDPSWTLHAAAEQGYAGPGAPWPMPWQAGARRAADRPHRRPEAPAATGPRGHRQRPATPAGGPRNPCPDNCRLVGSRHVSRRRVRETTSLDGEECLN